MQGSPNRSQQHVHHHPRGHRYAQQTAQLPKPTKAYNPRHPERTLLYRTVAEHFETWLELASAGQFDGRGDHYTPAPYVEKAFRKYLECGIFAHGFARVRCDDCGDDYLVAFSCKGRGVCPSCNTRRMAEAAAHLTDHVFPRLPVRQWVLSVPKRVRYYLQRDKGALNAALRIFLRVVQQSLIAACPGAAKADPASLHLSAVAFIHRFGSSLNTHVHFHVCVIDGVFEALAGSGLPGAESETKSINPPSITFHPAQIDDAAIATVQANVRKRILRAFVARGHLESHDAKDMAAYAHGGGFSVDAGVRIEAADRAGLERLLRYCARPPFAMDRLKQRGADLVYRCGKGHTEPMQSDKYSGELVLTPLELIDRIAQLVPPPRTHRHRYYGVLAPNSPLRGAVTSMAQVAAVGASACAVSASSREQPYGCAAWHRSPNRAATQTQTTPSRTYAVGFPIRNCSTPRAVCKVVAPAPSTRCIPNPWKASSISKKAVCARPPHAFGSQSVQPMRCPIVIPVVMPGRGCCMPAPCMNSMISSRPNICCTSMFRWPRMSDWRIT